MARHTVSWIMAVRRYGIVKADEMFPDDTMSRRPRRPARKLARTAAPKISRAMTVPVGARQEVRGRTRG
jgi:hypothetical protein